MTGSPDAARWRRIGALFEAVSHADPDHRDRALADLCPDDPALQDEVRALLLASARRGFVDELTDRLAAHVLEEQPEATPAVPVRIGRYEILEPIGRGGMGVVYKAHDSTLDRPAAIKLIAPEHARDLASRRQLLTEARAAAGLDHPSIATVYEAGETADGVVYLAMAYYEGETLASRLARGPFPLDDAVRVAREIAAGLAAAHARGITHRDLKPANVLLTSGGAVKLLDFGIARTAGADDTSHGQLLGTVEYMAPEQWLGEPVDPRTDVWAFGLVLYEMLTGDRPETRTARAILAGRRPPLPGSRRSEIPPVLDGIVERALAREPGARHRDGAELYAAIQHASGHAAAPAGGRRIGRAPAAVTSFFGREREVREISERLSGIRLLTLTGPGGTGKTRLAQQVAARIADRYPDGVAFVALAAISDPALVAAEICRAIALPDRPGVRAIDALVSFLGASRLLLVLDNFEHVLLAAPAVSVLLEECGNLQVLVTSRAPLKLAGEHEYPVSPLPLPAPGPIDEGALCGYAATALFVDRIRAVRPGFTITADEADAIAELSRRLDGLPLAIELAAARTRLFSPRAIVARLDQRLDLLSAGARDRPARHHSLRQAIAWSYDLLRPDEQAVFRRMAAFIGGCSLDDAAALGRALGAGPEVLARCEALLDQSLAVRDDGPDGVPRLRLLETIREFALERLEAAGEAPAARRAHAERFLALAEDAEPHLTSPDQSAWFDRLEADHANLREALGWAQRQSEPEIAMRLGAALWRFWSVRGYLNEGRERLEQILAMPGSRAPTALRFRVLHGAATLVHQISEFGAARPLAQEGLDTARAVGDTALIATGSNSLGWILVRTGEGAAAQAVCEEALRLNREAGDPRGVAVALHNLGWLAAYRGEFDRSCTLHEESLVWRRTHGDPRGLAFGMTQLAWSEGSRGRLARAARLLDDACATFERLGDRQLVAWALANSGLVERAAGRPDAAAPLFAASLERWRAVGNLFGIAFSLIGDAEAALDQGDTTRAARNLDEALPTIRRVGERWGLAWALKTGGRLDERRGRPREARAQYDESLGLWERIGNRLEAEACREALRRLGRGQAEAPA